MKNHYIQAVVELIESGADLQNILKGLQKTMQAKGHTRLYGPVLRGVLRILQTKTDRNTPVVTLARESDVTKYTDVIQKTLEDVGRDKKSDFSTTIDPTIIGGVTVTTGTTVVDKSYKRLLTRLYRSATH